MLKPLALAAALLATPAVADTSDGFDICEAVNTMATSIMSARQSGVPLNKMLDILKDAPEPLRNIAIEAYKKTRWNTEANQQRAITEFADAALIACLESET